ncbi:MAG: DNA mismatch repair protein MutS [Calditrichaeota bacterium]|nr:DNA mismatch repair protein MutS [Calditrichota bacterium]
MAENTPLMEQYWSVKNQHKNEILFFRMGDFYELFYDDARTASKVLGLTLTSRGHGAAGDVPLAGFPHHALEGYLAKMIRAGYKVAICEQVEDPKKAKKLVKREVTEIVTPGTILTDNLLDSKQNNYLIGIYFRKNTCGFSKVDLSTGEFVVAEFPLAAMEEQVLNARPSEVVLSEEHADYFKKHVRNIPGFTLTLLEDWLFSRQYAYEILTDHFKTNSLKGFGIDSMSEGVSAAGAVLHYLKENQKNELNHIRKIRLYNPGEFMILDPATLRNLEILETLSDGGREGSLFSVIDRTLTPMGGRLLRQWVQSPLRDVRKIRERLDGVEELVNHSKVRQKLETVLKDINDLERLVSRASTRRANAKDLVAIRFSLEILPEIQDILSDVEALTLDHIRSNLNPLPELTRELARALADNPPLTITDGGIIRSGYNAELDELREISSSGKKWIANLRNLERERTGISSLKIGYNKVFGYYIEVTKPHLSKVPAEYIRKQTLVNAERFITPELKEYEEKIVGAEEKMASLEYELFDELRVKVAQQAEIIQQNARLIAELDTLLSLAIVAEVQKYKKPIVNESDQIIIRNGRHPVVETLLPIGETFIPNDTEISNQKQQILVITGPNMAGKSTYIRQVGLIVLLAQMGSFVPADSAEIGVVDRIFTRVGASDNLAGGESTFLVEMNEMANILNNATSRSLLLLDEIGRGTSTFDGLSIAWSIVEFLHNTPEVAAKTLFATHYHELTELELILPRVKNYNVSVKEWGDKIIFLRKIVPGGSDQSYGIQVARLAGLPKEVISRAKEVLANLEADVLTPNREPKIARHRRASARERALQMDLFETENREIKQALESIDVNRLTPLEALLKLNELKSLINGQNKRNS